MAFRRAVHPANFRRALRLVPTRGASLRRAAPFLGHNPGQLTLIGAPLSAGQPKGGAELGPRALRDEGLVEKIEDIGWRVVDAGDLEFPTQRPAGTRDHPMAHNSQVVGAANKLLSDRVKREAEAGSFVLTLGGDHSVGIGTLTGILRARPDTNVIWVDAHADLNTPEASLSKNLHGMVLGLLTGLCDGSQVDGFEWLSGCPMLDPSRLVYIGLRDLDRFERNILRRSAAGVFTMQDIDRYGIGRVMEMVSEHLERVNPNKPVHLSVDIDSVDPFLAPSTGTLVRGGLTFRESNYICEAVCSWSQLCSMDLVEVNPRLNPDGAKSTAEAGVQLITSALGARIL